MENRDIIKVKLRNSGLKSTRGRIFFICSFLKKINIEEDIFFPSFNFVLNFLNEIDDHKNIFSALLKKKNDYLQDLIVGNLTIHGQKDHIDGKWMVRQAFCFPDSLPELLAGQITGRTQNP